MNLLFIHLGIPKALRRFASPVTPLMHRLAAPPRRLLALAARYPATWSKRVIDLRRTPLDAASLMPGDTAILDRVIGTRGLRPTARACAKAAVNLILPKSFEPAGGAPLPPGAPSPNATVDALPLWRLIDTSEYPSVSIPVCASPPAPAATPSTNRPRFRAPDSILAEITDLAGAGWRRPVHLYAPEASWQSEEALRLLAALARHPELLGPRQLRAELSAADAADERVTTSMARAGIRDVTLTLPLGGDSGCTITDDRLLIGLLKRLQRAGLQIQGGVALRDRTASWGDFVRDVSRVHASGTDRTLTQLLGATVGRRYLSAAIRAARSARLFTADALRGVSDAMRRFRPRPELVALVATIAIYSELQYATDAAS